jgi:hypothetical protein
MERTSHYHYPYQYATLNARRCRRRRRVESTVQTCNPHYYECSRTAVYVSKQTTCKHTKTQTYYSTTPRLPRYWCFSYSKVLFLLQHQPKKGIPFFLYTLDSINITSVYFLQQQKSKHWLLCRCMFKLTNLKTINQIPPSTAGSIPLRRNYFRLDLYYTLSFKSKLQIIAQANTGNEQATTWYIRVHHDKTGLCLVQTNNKSNHLQPPLSPRRNY